MDELEFPKTRLEFDERFGTEQACQEYLVQVRWPHGWRCARCGHDKGWCTARHLWHCAQCAHQTSLTAGTVMHSTKKPLTLWFKAMYLITSAKTGVSAKTLQRELGVSQQTAWAWLHKLRHAMTGRPKQPLQGRVEVDESYVGSVERGRRGRPTEGKALVVIAVEDKGKALGRARMVMAPDATRESLHEVVEAHVATGSTVHTDGWQSYLKLDQKGYQHHREVVSGETTRAGKADKARRLFPHVHQLAGLLKRWLLGTHQGAVRQKHLQAYLEEFVFRFNRRTSRYRTGLFQTLAGLAMTSQAKPYWQIVGRAALTQPLHGVLT